MRITHFIIALILSQSIYAQESVSISPEEIVERGIYDIRDLTTVVPGLFVTSAGSAQNTAVYMRGIGSRANAPTVGLYVDGIPWLEKSSFNTKIGEIERIEVLRGPQSTLYGKNTMGGLISITTKNPIDYQGTFVSRSMANHVAHFTGITHYQRFSEKLGFSAGAAYRSGGQYYKHSLTGAKIDADRSLRAHTRLLYRPNEKSSIDFLANYELCSQDAFPFYLERVPEDDPFRDQLMQDIGKTTSNEENLYLRHLLNVGLKAAYDGSKVTLGNVLSFQLLNDEVQIDRDFTHLDLGVFQQMQHSRTLYDEVTLTSRAGAWRHWQWKTGANFFYQWLHALYDTPSSGASLYHQSTLSDIFNAKGWDVTMGLRLDYSHASFLGDSKGWWQLLPRFSLQRSFSKGQVYGTVSRGNRSVGYNEPEIAWNYEVGTHLHPVADKLFVDASVFLTNVYNQQVIWMSPSDMDQVIANAGRSRSYGGEFSLRAQPTDRWQAHASYAYTHATFTDYQPSSDVSYNGNNVPFTPQHAVDLGVSYRFPVPTIFGFRLLERIKVCANWHGMGKIYWTEDNFVSEPFYNALDAKISFFRKSLDFSMWVNNIFDKHCRTFYFQHAGRCYSQWSKPFQFGFEVNILFK